MKKGILIILSVIMVISLVACAGNSSASGGNTPESSNESVSSGTNNPVQPGTSGTEQNVLVVYFSATGTTKKLAEYAANATGATLYEIVPEQPYTSADLNYSDRNSRSTKEMNDPTCRPAIDGSVENMADYDIVFIGYPIWWASIPMPIASFLEEYDFSGKTIIPFCSHGRFGQSLTAIAKLAPNATMGEGLSIHYSGGSALSADVEAWLKANKIMK